MVEAFIGQHRAVIDRALHAALVDAFVAKDEPILAGISRRLYSAHCGGAEEMLRAENNELKLKLEQAQAECEEKEAVIARLSCRKLTERAAVDFTRDSPAMSVDSRKLESDALAFLSGFDRLDDEPRSLWASVRRDLSDVARIEGARDSGSRSTAMSMAWLDSIPSGRASTQRPDSSCQSANTTSMAASEAVCQRALEAARAKLAVVEPPPSPRPDDGDDADDGGDDSLWTVSRWARSLKLDALLAEGLCEPLGVVTQGRPAAQRSAAELAFVRSLGQQSDDAHCRSMVGLLLGRQLDALAAAVCTGAAKLVAEQDALTEQDALNGKFVQPELFMAELNSFNSGLQAVVGLPHSSLREAMEREHTAQCAAPAESKSLGL